MRHDDNNPFEQEILAEKAASLFRITKKMESAFNALRDFDRQLAATPSPSRALIESRIPLLKDAAEFAWFFIVQRDALHMPNDDATYEEYGITDEIKRHMGPREKFQLR